MRNFKIDGFPKLTNFGKMGNFDLITCK